MDLAADILRQLDNPTLTANERALIRCEAAAGLIHAGQYEAAREALGELWAAVGERPNLEGLKRQATIAEVLLQCGVLTGWLGSARNISGSQESAKDQISEAQRMFESLHLSVKVAEALYELGIVYWRLGAFDEARVVLAEAADRIGDKDEALKAKVLIVTTMRWMFLKQLSYSFPISMMHSKADGTGRWAAYCDIWAPQKVVTIISTAPSSNIRQQSTIMSRPGMSGTAL
jgi:tetratricopeptide (TPR) repeat protein